MNWNFIKKMKSRKTSIQQQNKSELQAAGSENQPEKKNSTSEYVDIVYDGMEWRFVRKLKSEELITEYEQKGNYQFPEMFVEYIKNCNAAYPKFKLFMSKGNREWERVFNHFYSFNKDDLTTIWDYNDWNGCMKDWNMYGSMENYIAFAGDPFGNLICFDKTNDKIIFIDHETLQVQSVADSFDEFIHSLKKDEDDIDEEEIDEEEIDEEDMDAEDDELEEDMEE